MLKLICMAILIAHTTNIGAAAQQITDIQELKKNKNIFNVTGLVPGLGQLVLEYVGRWDLEKSIKWGRLY